MSRSSRETYGTRARVRERGTFKMSLAHIVALTNKTFRSWFIARNRRGGQEQEVVGVRIAVRSKEILVRAPAYASVVQPANARSGVNSDARV